jgi:RND family efflux transporter MFP subunit
MLWLSSLALACGCGGKDTASSTKTTPVKSEVILDESALARLTLTDKAVERLGITCVPVRSESVRRHTTVGGEVMIPSGRSTIVTAPVAGAIAVPSTGRVPLPGELVDRGAEVLTLVPLLSPERDVPTPVEQAMIANNTATVLSALAVAEGDVSRSQAEVEGARIAFNRAKQLLADRAGARRAADDAEAALNIGKANLRAAEERQRLLAKLADQLQSGPEASGAADPMPITAPSDGVLRSLSVALGQTVSANAPLFEVADVSVMWVRTPIYAGQLSEIDSSADARVVNLGGAGELPGLLATPISAPPSADPLSATVDLYFEVDNRDGSLRPGQRVGVDISTDKEQTALVIPEKSVLYDIYGGAWVYARLGEGVYERRRISVSYTESERVVLAEGPAEGTEVVVNGAAELFGSEFGIGK